MIHFSSRCNKLYSLLAIDFNLLSFVEIFSCSNTSKSFSKKLKFNLLRIDLNSSILDENSSNKKTLSLLLNKNFLYNFFVTEKTFTLAFDIYVANIDLFFPSKHNKKSFFFN